MNTEERQLKSIDVKKFRVIEVNNKTLLALPDEDTQHGGTLDCGEGFNHSDIKNWLKQWNIEQLMELKISPGASTTSRTLDVEEIECFETLRAKLLRCKQYALNYYENKIFDPQEDD